MIEIILQVAGEFLVFLFGEALASLGLHAVAEPFRRVPNPWLAALGYAALGAILGGLSLLVFPNNFARGALQILNLAITPLLVGGCAACVGAWRTRQGALVLPIDQFAHGYLLAFNLALVRFFFAA
jgi:hypothetical protein